MEHSILEYLLYIFDHFCVCCDSRLHGLMIVNVRLYITLLQVCILQTTRKHSNTAYRTV